MLVSILIDQNIISHGDTLSSGKSNDILGYARKPVPKDWQEEEFNCLPTISALAKSKDIDLYRYFELNMEEWKRGDSSHIKLGQLFSKELLNTLKPVMARGRFFSSNISEFLKTNSVEKYCIWLKSEAPKSLILNGEIKTEQSDKLIKDLKRYSELCRGLSDSQCIDALHLWHGEINKIDFFLTMDRKFINALKSYKTCSLCVPIMPSELLKHLKVEQLEKFDFEVGYFYGIGGNKILKLT